MRTAKGMVGLVLVLVLLAACGETSVVRDHCDDQMSYQVLKRDAGFRLYLHVGPVTNASLACSTGRRRYRQMNLEANVATVEEAVTLTDQYKEKYAKQARLAAEKP